MNATNRHTRKLLTVAVASVLLAACSTPMTRPAGADTARAKLAQLQADPQLASRAPVAIKEAELAVRAAEVPNKDQLEARHLVLMADRKVDTARALAQSRLLEDQRKLLTEQRETARLDARTREADMARDDASHARADASIARGDANMARSDATIARNQSYTAKSDADNARNEADAARSDATVARSQADAAALDAEATKLQSDDLQRQIRELNAKTTERGLVVTLGDVLFETGKSAVKGGSASNLSKLATFLNRYRDRSVTIEGHTDNIGSDASNQGLSQRRADSVKAYLVGEGVSSGRLSAIGKGESAPVASNDSTSGRQENRRVEVIIANNVANR